MNTTEQPLPDLQNALLDGPTIEQLFRDVENCTEVIEIIPKYSQQGYVQEGTISLADAKALLLSKGARAVQLRYRYQGSQWWDTVMAVQDNFRLVRIQHNF